MKIIDARTGSLQTIPFNLGEAGRGRHLEEVRISNRPGQIPSSPEDVGYFTFGDQVKHVIITGPTKQQGCLVRMNTRGVYTRGSCGSVSLLGGKATLLTEGQWAEGAAGNVASGPDQLWHVLTPSVFSVVLQGGASKGMGHRYVIVTRTFRVVMMKVDQLCQLIATDSDPDVSEVVRAHVAHVDEDVRSAIELADRLEDLAPESAASVQHFVSAVSSMTVVDRVRWFGLAVPVSLLVGDEIGGVSGEQSGALVPGTKELLSLSVGPGGGKRYSYVVEECSGITEIRKRSERPNTHMSLLAVVDDLSWRVRWTEYRDGAPIAYCVADVRGVHRMQQGVVRTEGWVGRDVCSPSSDEILEAFGAPLLRLEESKQSTPAMHEPTTAPAVAVSLDDLRRKFCR